MQAKPYSRYKPSGVEWLGDVPAHWEVKKLKYVLGTSMGLAFDSEDYIDDGIPLIRIGDIESTGVVNITNSKRLPAEYFKYFKNYAVNKGDILIAMTGATIGKVARYTHIEQSLLNQRVCKFISNSVLVDFTWCLLNSNGYLEYIKLTGFGGAQPNISDSQLLDYLVALPPLLEQRAIADFLDIKTAVLDELTAKKRSLLERLREHRTALISRAVTKGLPEAEARAAGIEVGSRRFKASGVEWLGDVPEHWEVGNIRRFCLMRTGHTPSRNEATYWEDCDIPWFTLADVWQLRDGKRKFLGETKELVSKLGLQNSAAQLLPVGTVILSRTASVGFSGIMPTPMATSQDFWNWVPGSKVNPDYLLYQMRAMQPTILSLTMGSTHKTIYQPDAARIEIAVPPLLEQRAIADYLDRETRRIDHLIARVEAALEWLAEYRSALITAAVTGKIDVREGVAV